LVAVAVVAVEAQLQGPTLFLNQVVQVALVEMALVAAVVEQTIVRPQIVGVLLMVAEAVTTAVAAVVVVAEA
jgi:hypothetical protein